MIVLKTLYYRVNGMAVPQRGGSSASLASDQVQLQMHWLLCSCGYVFYLLVVRSG